MTTRLSLLSLIGLTVLHGCSLFRPPVPKTVPVYHREALTGSLRAGAAVRDITPTKDLLLGGYGVLRRAEGVHDPLYARAVVLERGGVELALVAVDVVGLQRQDILRLHRFLDAEVDPRHLLIASTHNHNGPDTLGIWGFPPFVSGVERSYLRRVRSGILAALEEARSSLRSAEVAYGGQVVETQGLLKNLRRPGVVDPEVVVLHLRESGAGPTIATITELGCHPEVIERWNRQVTADFPHWTVSAIEQELGGTAIYVSGALGGLVAPDVERTEPPDPELEWREAERVGNLLASHTLDIVNQLTDYSSQPSLALWHAPLYVRNQNANYTVIRWTGLLERDLYGAGYFETEVNLWQVGDFRLASVPGEITPDLGLRIKESVGGRPTMIVGLGNDELGYLLPASEYDLPIYDYERTLCPGRDCADRIVRRLEDLGLLSRRTRTNARASRPETAVQSSD